jgi:hypothetical protein
MFLEVFLFVGALLLILYLAIRYGKFFKTQYQGPKQTYDLSAAGTTVLTPTDFTWTSAPCTLRFAIYVNSSPKTIMTVDCIDHKAEAPEKFAPDCADYSYRPCKCMTTDCGRCALDKTESGYMSKLLSIGEYVQLWASGYTNQNDKPYVSTLLKIRTGLDSNQHFMEAIPLPTIPLQKWTMITIVKEGRRFDVYYGAKLQVSKMTTYPPLNPDSGSKTIMAGNSKWGGLIGMFKGTNGASYAPDVISDATTILDTRGIPYIEDPYPFSLTLPKCFFGNCGGLPDVKPPNQFMVYQTNYS